ncbi:MAG: hypothetical protein V4440_03400 [Pseudomonadota bacterium]
MALIGVLIALLIYFSQKSEREEVSHDIEKAASQEAIKSFRRAAEINAASKASSWDELATQFDSLRGADTMH